MKKKNKIFNNNNNKFLAKILFLTIIIILFFYLLYLKPLSSLKIGVVGVRHETNIGNNLLKYAMSVKLSELGYIPYIIGTVWKMRNNIEFINKTTNLVVIKNNFSEIKYNDYDILMVNSDQTWAKFDKNFYDYGFLKFAENWSIPKFVYGASIGKDYWRFSREDEEISKNLLNTFSGISVREKDSIELIKKHLGINPEFVLDPTFLIDKNYYLNLIKDFKDNKTKTLKKNEYIFVYNIKNDPYLIGFMKKASKILNFEINSFPINNSSSVENFLYYLINSKAVITNSYHGTIFSIIFNKPFISFYKKRAKVRFKSLDYLFNISERLFESEQQPDCNLLIQPLNINLELLKDQKRKSINFLKNNLNNKLIKSRKISFNFNQ